MKVNIEWEGYRMQKIVANLWFDTEAMMGMGKQDIAALTRAAEGA